MPVQPEHPENTLSPSNEIIPLNILNFSALVTGYLVKKIYKAALGQ